MHDTDAHRHREGVLVESHPAFARRRFHRQKLHLVLSGLRQLADELGDRARYLREDTYTGALRRVARPALVHEPTSHAAAALVERLRADGLVAAVLPTPTFALSRTGSPSGPGSGSGSGWRVLPGQAPPVRRADGGGEPVVGRWNHDRSNREPPPAGRSRLDLPGPWQPAEDEVDERVRADLDALGLPMAGVDGRGVPDRMSDHCADCAYDPKRRLGERACPFTAGNWSWVHRHVALLAANHRTARAVASLNRIADRDALVA